MINPIEMLRRRVRDFVGAQLYGLVPWEVVKFAPPEETPRAKDNKGRPDGQWRERVTCRFFDISLDVSGPNDMPPMGRVAVQLPDGVSMEGPMVPETWEKVGACIREHFKGVE